MTRLSFFTILVVIFFDQFSKYFADKLLFVTCNEGIALGIGIGSILLPTLVVLLIFWQLTKEKKAEPNFGLSLIFAGGISNLADRVIFGCVRDFIPFINLSRFNLADLAITFGVLFIVYDTAKDYFGIRSKSTK